MRGGTGCDEAAYMDRRRRGGIRDACVARTPFRKLIKTILFYFRFLWGSVGRVIGGRFFFCVGASGAPSDAGTDGRGCRDACAVGRVWHRPPLLSGARPRGLALARACAVCRVRRIGVDMGGSVIGAVRKVPLVLLRITGRAIAGAGMAVQYWQPVCLV